MHNTQFRPFYKGESKSVARPRHKQELERHFHSRLLNCWGRKPLNGVHEEFFNPASPISSVRKPESFTFVPLVTERLILAAEIGVTLARPGKPALIITQAMASMIGKERFYSRECL